MRFQEISEDFFFKTKLKLRRKFLKVSGEAKRGFGGKRPGIFQTALISVSLMRKSFFSIVALCLPLLLWGQNECDELPIFPREAVTSAFRTFKVSPDVWTSVLLSLNQIDTKVQLDADRRISAEKKRLEVDELSPLAVAKLKHQALFNQFSIVMKEVGDVTDERSVFEIFEEIESERARLLWECYSER